MEDRQVSLKQVLDTVDEMPVMKDNNGMEFIEKSLAKTRIVMLQPELNEWCTDCKEYDQERHCCPRFNKVIRETVEEYKAAQPSFSQPHENDHIADDSKKVVPCEDAVSRKLMYELGATCMARRDENGELVALGSLDALPSVQPVARDINVLSNDLISRQDAIETSLEFFVEFLGGAFYENSQKELIARFQRLPSAQPDNDMIHLQKEQAYLQGWEEGREALRKEQRWIPVTLKTLPNLNSVVVVCGEKGTWDFGIYRGWYGDIHSWNWKNKSIKHVHWWMYKDDALPLPYREEGD